MTNYTEYKFSRAFTPRKGASQQKSSLHVVSDESVRDDQQIIKNVTTSVATFLICGLSRAAHSSGMKRIITIAALATAATAGAQSVELGLTGGYAGGLSGEVFVHSPNLIGPVGVKVGVSYSRAMDAIRDSNSPAPGTIPTFGDLKKPTSAGGLDAKEYGTHTVLSVDGTYGLGEVAPGVDTLVYAGARYGMFRSTEDYGSSSGSTTYSTNAFGIGAGAMIGYALTGNLSLVGDLGADYFFNSTINVASSNGTNEAIPTSETASYATTSDRFVRPGVAFKARLGVKYTF